MGSLSVSCAEHLQITGQRHGDLASGLFLRMNVIMCSTPPPHRPHPPKTRSFRFRATQLLPMKDIMLPPRSTLTARAVIGADTRQVLISLSENPGV